VELPDRPRKQPKQSRSVAMVNAIKEAGKQILEQRGRQALTQRELSAIAGVAVSSIYEYFPTLDALVTAIFDDYRQQILQQTQTRLAQLPPTTSCYDALVLAMQAPLQIRLKLHRIDPELHTKLLHHDELARLTVIEASAVPDIHLVSAVMARYPRQFPTAMDSKTAFILSRSIVAVTRAIAIENPQWLTDTDTARHLADMVTGLLRSSGAE
jgi:AcrR family transcriptional regulator